MFLAMFLNFSFPGNLFVILVIFSLTRMRKKVTNMFIISQSCTDLFVAVMLLGKSQNKKQCRDTVGAMSP